LKEATRTYQLTDSRSFVTLCSALVINSQHVKHPQRLLNIRRVEAKCFG